MGTAKEILISFVKVVDKLLLMCYNKRVIKKQGGNNMRTYYKVTDANGGQHGTFIETIELQETEFRKLSCIFNKGYELFTEYYNALDYILD